ncbi:MAG: protein kinase [Candidatus Paceibacterota bacterium]
MKKIIKETIDKDIVVNIDTATTVTIVTIDTADTETTIDTETISKMKLDKHIPTESDLSKFKKIVKIGQGSFGEVNLVRLMGSDDPPSVNETDNPKKVFFAMKRTLSKSKHKLKDNEWEKEYTILNMLSHKSIIRVNYLFKTTENGLVNDISGDYDNTITCLIMEYFPGCDLEKFIIKNHKLCSNNGTTYLMPIRDQLIICKALLDVIQYLHRIGIAHRDIKPSNIMYNEILGKIKLIDFSFASYCVDYPITPEHYEYLIDIKINKGTPLYMPRELVYNQDDSLGVQNRSDILKCDIWALGITLYFMFAGFEPYKAYSYKEFRKLMRDPPRPIYGVYHTTPEIEQMCQDCLTVRYQDRPNIDILHGYFMQKLNNIEVITDNFGKEFYINTHNYNTNTNNNTNNNNTNNTNNTINFNNNMINNEFMTFDFDTNFGFNLIAKNY